MKSPSSFLLCVILAGTAHATDKPVDYPRDVKPILLANCSKCHGLDEQEAGLRLDTVRSALEGGISGTAIVAGNSAESLLIQAVTGTGDVERMPPEDEAEKLPEHQIEILKRWIDQGAKFPPGEKPTRSTRESEKHWSFQPLSRPAVPTVNNLAWGRNPIDAFILAKLEKHSTEPSSEANRATLLRRVCFDLMGLPPTISQIETFLHDTRPGAYQRLVDRLLASPHYGERWGRHWLDVARYADSNGYTNDRPRQMWAYRDWVIDSLNHDLPFNQFTIEQFAGDMLPGATTQQIVATGFHRNTQINDEGGTDKEQYRVEAVVDRVHTTGVVFMGLTLGCARCHEHKYDPVSQKEFYQFFAFLNNQEEPEIKLSNLNTTTYVMEERTQPRKCFVHIRGDFLRKGRRVTPGVPKFLPVISNHIKNPNRLHLAQWLVSDSHPLTPRVTVNRIWQRYFGTGIVETENDFGTQGARPTHPELLDWLAAEFIRQGWSMKAMHRLIVTSATYRQTSHSRADLNKVDPGNQLLARQNRLRLEAESIRDAALLSSGLLSRKLKGPSVFPPQPKGVMLLTQNKRKWAVSLGEDRYRRGLYTHFWRSAPHPFLKLFNAPEANTSCTQRGRSNTPLQALTLLNDEAFIEMAQALAVRILREVPASGPPARLQYAFQLCLARRPQPPEMAALSQLLEAEMADAEGTDKQVKFTPYSWLPPGIDAKDVTAWTTVARTLMNLDEFITRE